MTYEEWKAEYLKIAKPRVVERIKESELSFGEVDVDEFLDSQESGYMRWFDRGFSPQLAWDHTDGDDVLYAFPRDLCEATGLSEEELNEMN